MGHCYAQGRKEQYSRGAGGANYSCICTKYNNCCKRAVIIQYYMYCTCTAQYEHVLLHDSGDAPHRTARHSYSCSCWYSTRLLSRTVLYRIVPYYTVLLLLLLLL